MPTSITVRPASTEDLDAITRCAVSDVLSLSRTPALDLDSLLTIECQPARIW